MTASDTPLPLPTALPLLSAHNVCKSFAGVPVLRDVSFDVQGGEVHALVGENGAGKSTLLKIMAGAVTADQGTINVELPGTPSKTQVALIHQEPVGFPDLSVAENVFVGHRLPRGKLGQLDWRAMRARAKQILASLGLSIDPRAKMRGLSIADQQMVELAAALTQDARVLLMDEPTASLTPREVDRLFSIVRHLRTAGCAIAFISHRLGEVFEIADRITVLRDGQKIATQDTNQTNPPAVINMMVGRPLSALYEKPPATVGPALLEVRDLTRLGRFAGISFSVRAGEIVGLAGLVGAGRTDVARALFGIEQCQGEIRVDGQPVRIRAPSDAIALGLAMVPEDRGHEGLLLPMSVAVNTSLADLRQVSRGPWLSRSREKSLAEHWVLKLHTRLRDVDQPAGELSGGNQQKVVLSKWLATGKDQGPRVLILDEPTRGIDIGAKADVHHLMAELARSGKAILMISSDLPEVLAMSDRVLVMREGRISAEFPRDAATQERVMAAATGEELADTESQGGNAPMPPRAAMPYRATVTGRGRRWLQFRELGIAAVVLLTLIICGAIQPRLLATQNLRNILLYIPLIVVIAMGQMMVIISRNIDLSVGSILGFAAIFVGNLFIDHPHMPLVVALLAAAGVGALMGLVNGLLVAILNIPAIIATLGTLTAYRGLIFIYSGGRQVDNNYLPPSLIRLSRTSPIEIPWIVLFAALVAVVTALWLRYAQSGREIFAIGSSPSAAVLRRLPIRRRVVFIFSLTGFLSGIAGLMFASRFGYVNPVTTGNQMELIVISAVVIGGTNVFGGSGSVLGVVLACFLLGLVNVALPVMGVSAFWQMALYGVAILLAATVDALFRRYGTDAELA
jgi:ABC-type sugar transport system ATPase subunit/ribose/xylose/arabinose/galactoside ABC-type transport system permease subunit